MKIKNQQGFTLVELMIVVAIIGVLATVGVPTYKKMVQKAKKAEAKVALGGLYTSNAAFYSEYSTYGNNLDKIGFEMEGAGTGRIFTIGFPTNGCASTNILPAHADGGIGAQLFAVFPNYFPGGAAAPSETPDATNRTIFAAASNVPTACLAAAIAQNSYLATATGKISPSANVGTILELDQWSINENRQLVNVNDGVR